MKLPMPPPSLPQLMAGTEPTRLVHIINSTNRSGLASTPYRPWDEVRYRKPPHDLTPEEWWLGTKLARRSLQREIPLVAVDGSAFRFAIPDEMLQMLERITRDASGQIAVSEQVTNPATRDRYLVSSLIEEAITSSQLEGAVTTHDVAKEMLRSGRPPRDRSERMIVNNFLAMQRIGDLRDEPLTPELICEIQRIVTDGTLRNPDAAGRFQTESDDRISVWETDGVLLHRPPPARLLPGRMQKLCAFANGELDESYMPAVIRALTVHFMVGYDHPFEDGNGRTARALFYWSMLNQGYWLTEFLAISRILKKAPSKYMRSFLHTEQDEGDLTYFYLYHLNVVARAIDDLHDYLGRKMAEIREFQKTLAATVGRFNHRETALLRHAISKPGAGYTILSHARSHKTSHETARQDLLHLASLGVLERTRQGHAYVFVPVPDVAERLRMLAA